MNNEIIKFSNLCQVDGCKRTYLGGMLYKGRIIKVCSSCATAITMEKNMRTLHQRAAELYPDRK